MKRSFLSQQYFMNSFTFSRCNNVEVWMYDQQPRLDSYCKYHHILSRSHLNLDLFPIQAQHPVLGLLIEHVCSYCPILSHVKTRVLRHISSYSWFHALLDLLLSNGDQLLYLSRSSSYEKLGVCVSCECSIQSCRQSSYYLQSPSL